MTRIIVRIDANLYAQFKNICTYKKTTVSDAIREFVRTEVVHTNDEWIEFDPFTGEPVQNPVSSS